MNRILVSSIAAACVSGLIIGCQSPAPAKPVAVDVSAAAAIDPLTEAEFDAFAGRTAAAISEFLRRSNAPLPAYIALPRVHADGVETRTTAAAFARIFAQGLNDRLTGLAIVGPRGVDKPDFAAELLFGKGKTDARERIVLLRVIDPRTRETLVNEGYAYRSGPAPEPSRLAADEVAPGNTLEPLAIDAPRDQIAELARRHVREFPGRLVEGSHGQVCFVTAAAQNALWLQEQRATWSTSNNLRLVFEFRAKQRVRLANLRLIMLDAFGDPVEVTPVIPYRFDTDFTKPVHFSAHHPQAEQYLLLVDLD